MILSQVKIIGDCPCLVIHPIYRIKTGFLRCILRRLTQSGIYRIRLRANTGLPNFLGVLAGLPLLLAGITIGGIGGGDVKLMGACGLILGASQALTGLFLALCLLVLWHAAGNMGRKKNRKKQKEEKEQAYPLVPFLFAGMLIGIWIGG